MLAACEQAAPAPVPLAPGLESPADYSFGSSVGAADARARGLAIDRLQPEFGPLKAELHRWPADRPVAELRSWYARRLKAEGWEPIVADDRLAPGAWMDAWRQGDSVIALVGQISAEPGDRHLPVTILTNRSD
jgi:hypothetical protein